MKLEEYFSNVDTLTAVLNQQKTSFYISDDIYYQGVVYLSLIQVDKEGNNQYLRFAGSSQAIISKIIQTGIKHVDKTELSAINTEIVHALTVVTYANKQEFRIDPDDSKQIKVRNCNVEIEITTKNNKQYGITIMLENFAAQELSKFKAIEQNKLTSHEYDISEQSVLINSINSRLCALLMRNRETIDADEESDTSERKGILHGSP